MIRIVSIIVATLLFCYIVFVSFFFRESRQKELCRDLQVVVVDSLDKHFVSEMWLTHYSPSLTRPDEFMDKVKKIFPRAKAARDGWTKELMFEEESGEEQK